MMTAGWKGENPGVILFVVAALFVGVPAAVIGLLLAAATWLGVVSW